MSTALCLSSDSVSESIAEVFRVLRQNVENIINISLVLSYCNILSEMQSKFSGQSSKIQHNGTVQKMPDFTA